jgi:hypothetical protein
MGEIVPEPGDGRDRSCIGAEDKHGAAVARVHRLHRQVNNSSHEVGLGKLDE